MRTQALIIGGGVTGAGLSRDLALRGVRVLVVEQRDINAGASGRNHGLLHSGGRYVSTDPGAAKECHQENEILKRVAPHCIEDTGGLFVAVEGDDETYVSDFPHLCRQCGIPCEMLDLEEAENLEPALSSKMIAAYRVDDGAIDPFRLSLENIAQAQELGATLLRDTKVVGFEKENRQIKRVQLFHMHTGQKTVVEAEQVINAAGPWVGEVAALAGIGIEMLYSKGTLLVTAHRVTDHVVNRLRNPGDGDILVPGGTVSLLGTTSVRIDSPDLITPTVEEVDLIVNEGSQMIPTLKGIRYFRSYAGVRPLLKVGSNLDDRSVSRGFALLDHARDGLENFATIPSGKLTTFRFMAEKTADLICEKLGVHAPCSTRTESLPDSSSGKWTEPALGAKHWFNHHAKDPILCDCEMVPESAVKSVVNAIIEKGGDVNLLSIGVRSRVGKGVCQGTFCGKRVSALLEESGEIGSYDGLIDIRRFLQGRWSGERPVLWHAQIMQAELKEAFYCGAFNLEVVSDGHIHDDKRCGNNL
ncbi:glycerol-3-phosphate dehydrogenase, anaerobic, A subunit [delta proteobacterium NaphS2]|nr:glycerol-3-phosphate dehydrogenase, anaerobic, A subunit [delta proteobacterium NaphS2]